MKTKLFLFTVRTPAGIPPAIFADLSGDSTPGFDFTSIQQLNLSLSGFCVFEHLDTRLPISTGTQNRIGQGNIAELRPNELSYRPFSATRPGPLRTRYHRTCLVDCSYLNAIGPPLSTYDLKMYPVQFAGSLQDFLDNLAILVCKLPF